MKVTFLLPSRGTYPTGGFKIVYEYANRLARKGYKITVVHSARILRVNNIILNSKKYISFIYRNIDRSFKPKEWFKINNDVKMIYVTNLNEKNVPDSDIIIATSWDTAVDMSHYHRKKGIKLYFIQSLETWSGPKEKVINTWKLPFKKIVISKWLQNFGYSLNEETIYIPNGLDYEKFGVDYRPEDRINNNLLMILHNDENKGSRFGIEAILKLKKSKFDINVSAFGAVEYLSALPPWINYYKNPNQSFLRALYNSAAIFLSPSLLEGFPLPPAEAMMCGCALIASDIDGHREYAKNEENSLLFKPKDILGIENCIKKLITNKELRCKLAYNGYQKIQNYNWENSVNLFESVLKIVNN